MVEEKTDVAPVEQTDASPVVEATPAPETELNLEELVPTSKKSKEARGGLSRKEFAESKSNNEELEALRAEMEELKELASMKEELTTGLSAIEKFNAESRQKEVKSIFDTSLNAKGINAATFNAEYKEAYQEKFNELVSGGLNETSAAKFALDVVLNPVIARTEEAARTEGRTSAGLPPQSSTNIGADTFPQVANSTEYSKLFETKQKELGSFNAAKEWKLQYDAYQEKKGRPYWKQ